MQQCLVLTDSRARLLSTAECLFSEQCVVLQAYLILDEFMLAGELQESSKQVIKERISLLDMLDLS